MQDDYFPVPIWVAIGTTGSGTQNLGISRAYYVSTFLGRWGFKTLTNLAASDVHIFPWLSDQVEKEITVFMKHV